MSDDDAPAERNLRDATRDHQLGFSSPQTYVEMAREAARKATASAAPGMTFLDMVRRLSTLTRPGCDESCMDSIHRHDAAWHLGAILADPVLLAELVRRADNRNTAAWQDGFTTGFADAARLQEEN